jgi:hypothetical protein
LDGISHVEIDLLRPSRTRMNNKVSTVEVFLERLADGGEGEACKTPRAERYGLCRLLEGDASPLCPPPCGSPVCRCKLFASHLALLAYYFLLTGRRAAAEALAPAVERAAREAERPCLSACLREALSGREPAPCPPEEGGLYCLALAALIDPGRRGEAMAAVERAVEEALELPPEEAAEGYGIVEGGRSSVELYFLYRMLHGGGAGGADGGGGRG